MVFIIYIIRKVVCDLLPFIVMNKKAELSASQDGGEIEVENTGDVTHEAGAGVADKAK